VKLIQLSKIDLETHFYRVAHPPERARQNVLKDR